jgi:hypothetical protein
MTTMLHSFLSSIVAFFSAMFGLGLNEPTTSLGLGGLTFVSTSMWDVDFGRPVVQRHSAHRPSHSARRGAERNQRDALRNMQRTRRTRGQNARTGA